VTRIYDKLDWHAQAAVEAGEPLENAFTHIGLFLTWLIRHDLHDTMLIHAEWADAVKAGEMTGSDLASALDEALVADAMTDDGRHFADSYYDTYLSDYDTCFKGSAPYSIPDDSASYARIAPAIDRAYAAWVDSGRPAPQVSDRKDNSELGGEPGEFEGEIGMLVSDIPDPHESRELEALIPADLTDSPMRVSSVRGTYWGDSLLNQALRRLGMRPADCLIANGIAGRGPTSSQSRCTRSRPPPLHNLTASFRTSFIVRRVSPGNCGNSAVTAFISRRVWIFAPASGRTTGSSCM
jgi:hypothetical protein